MELSEGISKVIVSKISSDVVTYPKESRFTFDYQIHRLNADNTLLDDTVKYGKPMFLYSGKGFQIQFWEQCLESMHVGEVSKFTIDSCLLVDFPLQCGKLRDYFLKKQHQHRCGMMADTGIGYSDLDELLAKPETLQFTFTLHKVELPSDKRKESWIMTESEKRIAADELKSEGNELFNKQEYRTAADKYCEALGLLEGLMHMERPQDEKWKELDCRKIPLLLNLSQCLLFLKDFYAVIRHCSYVIDLEPDNVKALYRRGKAHAAVWNQQFAVADLDKVKKLDPSLTASCNKILATMVKTQADQDSVEKKLSDKLLLA